jgi:hypothetical protein
MMQGFMDCLYAKSKHLTFKKSFIPLFSHSLHNRLCSGRTRKDGTKVSACIEDYQRLSFSTFDLHAQRYICG